MALIICKECGKKVSDTRKNCIHCGADLFELLTETPKLQAEEANPGDYSDFSPKTRAALKEEFLACHPGCRRFQMNVDEIFSFVMLMLWSILGVLGFNIYIYQLLYGNAYYRNLLEIAQKLSLLCIFPAVYSFVVILVRGISYKKKNLIFQKMYQAWLREEKNINYRVTFLPKDKKKKSFFESIDLRYQKL